MTLPYQRLALVVLQPGLELPHDVFLDLNVVDVLGQHLYISHEKTPPPPPNPTQARATHRATNQSRVTEIIR